jgi:putative redox protein
MMTTVDIRTMSDSSLAAGSAGPTTVTIDRAKETGGYGLGFNGGKLPLLAIGGCYSNDIFREAGKRGISVRNVRVTIRDDWSGEPVRAQNVSCDVAVEADAPRRHILELIQHPDRVAEIPNSLRFGTEVKLAEFKAIPLP